MKIPKESILLFLKGMGMGGANIVPGVSGGTIAFITGIYEELITCIKSVDIEALKLLITGKFLPFWTKINGRFLVILLFGVLAGLISLAKLTSSLLVSHPIQLWSFFFGLIAISALVVSRDIQKWGIQVILSLIIGCTSAYLITEAAPAETPNNIPVIFGSGAIAISSMILPGISGSLILLILGKYSFILNALEEFDLGVLVVFTAGCLVGLVTFSRLISWLFEKYRDITIAILAGFMIGSLNKVWPWKETLTTFTDRHGTVKPLNQDNILPATYETLGNEAFVWHAMVFFVVGVGLVIFLEKLASILKNG